MEADLPRTTQAMSEEQLKAAETEATAQVEEGVEEISEEDLGGVAGGEPGSQRNLREPVIGNGFSYNYN